MFTLNNILLSFIPIFVAVDAIGVLPIFVSITKDLGKKEKQKIIVQSMITAICLAVGFILLGKAVFRFLNITVGDFMVAGGILLFCIAVMDILNPFKNRSKLGKELGAVPLGTPLIVGPAVLTTSLMIISVYGFYTVVISILLNVLIAGMLFLFSDLLLKYLGDAGTKALSKIASLFLAAIAVMMIRKGLILLLALPLVN